MMLMRNRIATLSLKEDCYSVFRVGDLKIKFYTSPYLQQYCKVDLWEDDGYIEYTGKFSTSSELVEDSIDLAFIAKRLHLSKDVFKGIEEVKLI